MSRHLIWSVILLATTAAGSSVAQTIGVSMASYDDQFLTSVRAAMSARARELNVKIQFTEQFLHDTDPRYVSLCLDTGHLAYRHADVVSIIRRYSARIGYVRIKQMDPRIVEIAERDDLPFGKAVAVGASREPPVGEPNIAEVSKAPNELNAEVFVVVEQDTYPVTFDRPKPIAERARKVLHRCGIGRRTRRLNYSEGPGVEIL